MASKNVILEGVSMWAKVFEDNRDMHGYKGAYDDTNGRTTINVLLDADNYKKLQSSGTMKRGKPEGDLMNVKFERKWDTGRDFDSGPPQVLKSDGNPWVFEDDGYIGNGSIVKVLINVTDLPKQGVVSTRLETVKVLKKEEYDNANDLMTKDESDLYGSAVQDDPEPIKDDVEETSDAYLFEDDEIPF
jgi:hypothetical protein